MDINPFLADRGYRRTNPPPHRHPFRPFYIGQFPAVRPIVPNPEPEDVKPQVTRV
jgi:hypothetical protein